ncbi:MAG: carbonic anhydrase [Candidatus Helarchaeota archaeon]
MNLEEGSANLSLLKKLLSGNLSFQGIYLKYASKLPSKPRKTLALLTCSDVRLNPIRIFHLNVGDVMILRNTGNIVTSDVVRSLKDALAKGVREIVILGHTDCTLSPSSSSDFEGNLDEFGIFHELFSIFTSTDLKAASNPEQNVIIQVTKLRANSTIPINIPIHGLLFDVLTGAVKVLVNGYSSLKNLVKPRPIGLSLKLPPLHLPSISHHSFISLKSLIPPITDKGARTND